MKCFVFSLRCAAVFIFVCQLSTSSVEACWRKTEKPPPLPSTTTTTTTTTITTEKFTAEEPFSFGGRHNFDSYELDHFPYKGSRNVAFEWRLIKEITKNEGSNILISPLSLKLLLTLLLEGAGTYDSSTRSELRQILQDPIYDNIQGERQSYNKILTAAMEKNENYVLDIGTNIFVQKEAKVAGAFREITKQYLSGIEQVNFDDVQRTKNLINGWCSNVTHGHIKNLIDDNSIRNAVMLLVNAIYFKGLWYYPFPQDPNNVNSFYLSDGSQHYVNYMSQKGIFYFVESAELKSQILRQSYKGQRYSMFFILPYKNVALNDVLTEISKSNATLLVDAMGQMDELDVNVTLPLFQFDFTSNMNSALKSLGIKSIFTDDAAFPYIFQGKANSVKVSNVVQKAGIVVNEYGAEAYAATDIGLIDKFGGEVKEYVFNANRPFIFFIEDETTGALLFAGKVENPLDAGKL